jgi:tetratricopeptide (TPR) repeat protein
MFALSLAAGIRVLVAVQTTAGSGAGGHAGIAAQSYLLTQGVVILRYLRMLLLPWGFSVDPEIQIASLWTGLLAWAAVIGLVLLAWRTGTRSGAGIWFLGGLILLLPSSSIFPANDLAADYRMYLPMIGFAASIGLLLERVRPIYLAPAFLALVCLSYQRTAVWRSEESLWIDAVRKAPGKVRPRIQLARAVEPARALEILEQARRIAPADPRIPSEEGRVYLSLGEPARALPEFGRVLALDPGSAEAFNNRGVALLALDQKEAAVEDFERALARDPCQFNALLNLRRAGVVIAPPPQCKFTVEQRSELGGALPRP